MVLAAALLPLLPAVLRRIACVAAPVLSLSIIATAAAGNSWSFDFIGQQITLMRCDPLSRVFGLVFAVAAIAASLYGWHRRRLSEQIPALVYAGGGMSVVFAGDLLSLLIAWEAMAVSSALLVFAGRKPAAVAAGFRYLLIHLAAGGLMLIAITGLISAGHGLAFDHFTSDGWPAFTFLCALCINAAVPPLHGWLPDAYPASTVSGSVFLSTFTTKAAVYCLVRGFAGNEALIWFGAVMAVYGVVFATLEDDMRRLLSYHIVSQVGYMVCGVGIGTALALNGAVAHAVCHILYKSLLFMAVGAVIYSTGRNRLSELGGLYSRMPLTLIFYMIGVLSISGAPLLNGFVSKSLIVSGAGDASYAGAAFLLTLASVGTFLSVGLKLPYFAWGPTGRGRGDDGGAGEDLARAGEPPLHMLAAMAIPAALCVVIGLVPELLYRFLPNQPVAYQPYSAHHVFEMLLVMALGAAAFWQLRGKLTPHAGETLDLDQLYRRPAGWLANGVSVAFDRTADRLAGHFARGRDRLVDWTRDPTRLPGSFGDERDWFDENARRPPIGTGLSWMLATLALVAAALFFAS